MLILLKTAARPAIARSALGVALVVGTILNIVNQGEALLSANNISWGHVLMNYLVPFCVASYSAARNELRKNG